MTRRCCIAVLLLGILPAAVHGQTRRSLRAAAAASDPLFDDSVLHDISLAVNSKDWQFLKQLEDDTYYPCDFRWRDQAVRGVGIRSRGNATRSAIKPGLRIDFNRYTSGQTFLGLKSFILRNDLTDASFMHERLTMLLYKRLGMPAEREAYARLFVNGEYVGLYTIVESVDEQFLDEWFADGGKGYLYEFKWPGAAYYFGPRAANGYVPLPFEPKTHEDDPRPEFIEDFVSTLNNTSDAVFRSVMAEYLDLAKFIRHIAVEQFVGDRDGFLGTYGMANFDFYRFDQTKMFTFIVWDKSEAFKDGPNRDIFYNITGIPTTQQNRLMTRAMAYADLYDLFLDTELECARLIAPAAPDRPGWLATEIEREYQQIRDAALADPLKPFTNDEFEAAVEALRAFARTRADVVVGQVSEGRARRPSQ
jgi:spore coat protein CotH